MYPVSHREHQAVEVAFAYNLASFVAACHAREAEAVAQVGLPVAELIAHAHWNAYVAFAEVPPVAAFALSRRLTSMPA